ncbi:MAG TPA: hypothetical protein PKE69_03505 [Pyrinomonadaceae bacterium]|nr:hypothetical protein [Pyrinomonadaceae bacterium]
MKNLTIVPIILTFAISGFSQSSTQKGIDPQTQQIKQDSGKTTQTTTTTNSGDGRSLDWGKGKTRVRERLANPYKMTSRRDVLIETIRDVMESMKILIDDTASRPSDGIIVSQPYVFAKGAVTTRSELSRYAVLPYSDSSWTRGRFTLTVEVQSIDGVQNNVAVTAKVEGRSENGLMSEWTTLQSAGTAEEEFLIKLVESVTGVMVDPTQDND